MKRMMMMMKWRDGRGCEVGSGWFRGLHRFWALGNLANGEFGGAMLATVLACELHAIALLM